MATDPNSVTLQQASDQYGQLAQVLWNIPDLKSLIQLGIAQTWSPAYFEAQFKSSNWYQQHSDTARSWLMTQAADPTAWQNSLQQAINLTAETAQAMGRSVNATSLATQYLLNGWTTDTLKSVIGQQGGYPAADGQTMGAYSGDAGSLYTKMESIARGYGVPYTQSSLEQWLTRIQSGADTIDGFNSLMQAHAKSAFPQFAAQIDAGQTVAQIADPYIAQMSKTLELPETSITLDTPQIQQALSQRDPKTGQATSVPMWQFDQQLKSDPRYANTEGARNDAVSVIHQIGKDFGYLT